MLRLFGLLLLALSLGIAHAEDASAPAGLDLSYSLDVPAGRAPIDPALSEPDYLPLTLARSLTTDAQPAPAAAARAPAWASIVEGLLLAVMLFLLAHNAWRWRTMWRALARRHHATGIVTADWPPLAIVLPGGIDAAIIAQRIQALLAQDYPTDRIFFLPLSCADAPLDQQIFDRHPALPAARIRPIACAGVPRDSLSALHLALPHAPCELIVTLDAHTAFAPRLLQQIGAAFLDPAVGALQGTRRSGAAGTLPRLLALSRHATALQHAPGSHEHLLPGATLVGLRRGAALACDVTATAPVSGIALVERMVRHGWRLALLPMVTDIDVAAPGWGEHLRRVRASHPFAAPAAHGDFTLPALRDRLDPLGSLAWMLCLTLSTLLYAIGKPLLAGPGIAVCALLSFDAHGGATDLLRALFPLRATRHTLPPSRIRLLPLMPVLHLLAIAQPALALAARVQRLIRQRIQRQLRATRTELEATLIPETRA